MPKPHPLSAGAAWPPVSGNHKTHLSKASNYEKKTTFHLSTNGLFYIIWTEKDQ